VAIVGGSGAGKSWLADQLQRAFGRSAVHMSLDNFYLDRSHLTPARRARINYDHPRAIDWAEFRRALAKLSANRRAALPQYDFTTHCRLAQRKLTEPAQLVLVDGLWLLRNRSARKLFDYSVFLYAPVSLRLRRRLGRDQASRGRRSESVRAQFRATVEPMHQRYVQPQERSASRVLQHTCGKRDLAKLVASLRKLLNAGREGPLRPRIHQAGSKSPQDRRRRG
jgi:uridine kinase